MASATRMTVQIRIMGKTGDTPMIALAKEGNRTQDPVPLSVSSYPESCPIRMSDPFFHFSECIVTCWVDHATNNFTPFWI